MTARRPDAEHPRFTNPTPATRAPTNQAQDHERGHCHGHGSHRLMMLLMCLPMFLIVGFLVFTGAVGSGVFLGAFLCMGVMMLMMYAMPGGHGHS